MKIENGFKFEKLSKLVMKKNICIVASKWNDEIVSPMIQESLSYMEKVGIKNINIVRVPGAWEIPYASLKSINNGAKGIIAFGSIIKGETPHFELIANATADALMKLSIEKSIPIANGILATNNIEQAIERSSVEKLNKGKEITQSLLEIMEL